ncbi:MAG: sigma-70 family RNA polymerase sigma factor [Clostridia bacterium]|nr:sigma-70 family RNA polymerase sigma factor [Clostridia bacterium]
MISNELIRRGASGDALAKEVLLRENQGMIYMVVNKFRHRGVETEDLFQIAAIGFLKAIERFDTTLGLQFSTYAIPVMIGEIKRYLRDNGPIKVSRRYRELAIKAEVLREKTLKETGKEPTICELAASLMVETEELAAALCAAKPPESLEGLQAVTENLPADNTSSGVDTRIIDRLSLIEQISTLPDREKKIILLRYIKELTQAQIASMLGISQVQVSRLEKKILAKLRTEL